jgi:sugar phosphate permease
LPSQKPFPWAWLILAICFVDLFINYSVRLGYGVILPEMIQTLGFGRTAGGTIYNSYLFTYILITPFTGFLTDRLGARRVIAVCLLFLGIGVTAMGTADSLPGACLFYALAGLGATGLWTPIITLVQRWFAHHRRGLALGILSTGYGMGLATVGAVFPFVVASFSWRYAWYFLGGLAILMVAVNGVLLRSDPAAVGLKPWGGGAEPDQSGAAVKSPGIKAVFGLLLRDSCFWLIGLSYFAIAYCLYGFTTFMVDYAQHQLQLPLEQASFLATIHGIFQVVGVLVVLPLSDYIGRKKTILISNACIMLALIGILLAGPSRPLLYGIVGFMAIFYGATFPIYGACAGDYFPREVMGTVIGAWTPFYGFGAILTHWVTGLLRDTTGRYDTTFVICAAMAVVSLILISFVKRANQGH